MEDQMMFTEEEFAIMEEALTDLRQHAVKASKLRIEVEDKTNPMMRGLSGIFGGLIKDVAQDYAKEASKKAENITLLTAKLIGMKRHHRQQGVSSNTAAQA